MELTLKQEVEKCLLCHQGKCSAGCDKGMDPAGVLFSLRFDNLYVAKDKLTTDNPCATCNSKGCETACVRNKLGDGVKISRVMHQSRIHLAGIKTSQAFGETYKTSNSQDPYSNLKISFFGKLCDNPFMLSSSVVASNYEMVAKAFDMGWGGACFKTIGKIVQEKVSPRLANTSGEVLCY